MQIIKPVKTRIEELTTRNICWYPNSRHKYEIPNTVNVDISIEKIVFDIFSPSVSISGNLDLFKCSDSLTFVGNLIINLLKFNLSITNIKKEVKIPIPLRTSTYISLDGILILPYFSTDILSIVAIKKSKTCTETYDFRYLFNAVIKKILKIFIGNSPLNCYY